MTNGRRWSGRRNRPRVVVALPANDTDSRRVGGRDATNEDVPSGSGRRSRKRRSPFVTRSTPCTGSGRPGRCSGIRARADATFSPVSWATRPRLMGRRENISYAHEISAAFDSSPRRCLIQLCPPLQSNQSILDSKLRQLKLSIPKKTWESNEKHWNSLKFRLMASSERRET